MDIEGERETELSRID